MPIIYVLDGKINTNSMTSGGKNKDSIIKELKNMVLIQLKIY